MDELNDGLYIDNAGLVILAPFLPRFFQQLGMVEDGSFITASDAERAVLLLQYLATGQQKTEEHLLLFNKILCGLPLDYPVPSSIEITEEEASMVRSLLNAVLQNWDKMSNSSVDNLRASFLLREGLLKEEEDHWGLVVEPKGYDIILSFLPWTISVVHLPWMEKRVEVDWKTSMG
ncbi:contractile injection system tape measure protein [Lewinella sp. LCG006]|uniref:contractile injection system tape measure protein n=1 Tax=Lewinella sp. LCG006 TaxID=3231911 RepID=UPI00345F3F9F